MIQFLRVSNLVRPEEITKLDPSMMGKGEYLVYTEGLVKGWHVVATADLAKVLFP